MDRGGDELIGWSIDGVAAGLLGAALGACLLLLGMALPAVVAASAGCLLALAALRQVRPEPRRFRVPAFALVPVEVAPAEPAVLELTEVLGPEPLELEDRLDDPATDSRVVQLFAPRPLPTPGELARRIERHLGGGSGGEERGGTVLDLEADASAALRQALGELRRSLA
ncbi:hypothetical protein [Sphingomonas glaciei]|uniref:Uncharacterized protein n=1 Tax=Sphingomonas glaciei TaxID=2938948 RepID=A0ABY5MYE7_9SPHN|nr:hypothetical protein [Sphingomonas glaciei]UUR08479.1 hypothetical protein M1K48_02190 [Sphingomonas glaciei]